MYDLGFIEPKVTENPFIGFLDLFGTDTETHQYDQSRESSGAITESEGVSFAGIQGDINLTDPGIVQAAQDIATGGLQAAIQQANKSAEVSALALEKSTEVAKTKTQGELTTLIKPILYAGVAGLAIWAGFKFFSKKGQ